MRNKELGRTADWLPHRRIQGTDSDTQLFAELTVRVFVDDFLEVELVARFVGAVRFHALVGGAELTELLELRAPLRPELLHQRLLLHMREKTRVDHSEGKNTWKSLPSATLNN